MALFFVGRFRKRRKAGGSVASRIQGITVEIGGDKSEWIVVRNTHEGIVTQEEFDRANANMRDVAQEKRKNPATKKNFSVIVCPLWADTAAEEATGWLYVLPYGTDAPGQPMR